MHQRQSSRSSIAWQVLEIELSDSSVVSILDCSSQIIFVCDDVVGACITQESSCRGGRFGTSSCQASVDDIDWGSPDC